MIMLLLSNLYLWTHTDWGSGCSLLTFLIPLPTLVTAFSLGFPTEMGS